MHEQSQDGLDMQVLWLGIATDEDISQCDTGSGLWRHKDMIKRHGYVPVAGNIVYVVYVAVDSYEMCFPWQGLSVTDFLTSIKDNDSKISSVHGYYNNVVEGKFNFISVGNELMSFFIDLSVAVLEPEVFWRSGSVNNFQYY